jgi:capsular polysaccharide biosynthesis protein
MDQETNRNYIEDEIDLREVLNTLLAYKWIIIGVALVMAVIAFGVTKYYYKPQYKATALIVITKPLIETRLDSRIHLSPQLPEARMLSDMATADEMMVYLREALLEKEGYTKKNISAASLRSGLSASMVGNTQLRLEVNAYDADEAALIANTWAAVVAETYNDLFGVSDLSLSKLEQQKDITQKQWDEAELSIQEFMMNSSLNSLEVTLEAEQEALLIYREKYHNLVLLLHDIQTTEIRLNQHSGAQQLKLDDILSLIILHQRSVGESDNLQIQITNLQMLVEDYTITDAIENVLILKAAVLQQQDELEKTITQLEDKLNQTAALLEVENYGFALREAHRDAAMNAFQALSSQEEATRISVSQDDQALRVVGQVLPPENPSGLGSIMNAAVAGFSGFLITAIGALFINWWKSKPIDMEEILTGNP